MHKGITGIVAICVFLILIYGFWVEPRRIFVNHIYLDKKQTIQALRGKVAVHLSDLHIQKMGRYERRLLAEIEGIKPDFIFLTGDFVRWNGDYGPALEFLSLLRAKYGIWGVLGDYDYSNSRESCLFCHLKGSGKPTSKHRVHFLRDSASIIQLSNLKIPIVGFSSQMDQYIEKNNVLMSVLKKKQGIVLMHNPLNFNKVPFDTDALILAGDTHGGQVPLPVFFWRLIGYEKNATFNRGWFEAGKKRMFVSSGIGTSHLRFRMLRPPEVIVLHF